MLTVVDQCPLRRALIAQPVVFHLSLLLPCSDKRWNRGRSRSSQSICFHQEQLAFPEPQEGFVATCIGTMAKHDVTAFRSPENTSENSQIRIRVHVMCHSILALHQRVFSVVALPTQRRNHSSCRIVGRTCRCSVFPPCRRRNVTATILLYAEDARLSSEIFRCRRSEKPIVSRDHAVDSVKAPTRRENLRSVLQQIV